MGCCGQNRERAMRVAQLRAANPHAEPPVQLRRRRRGSFPPALWMGAVVVLAAWAIWIAAVVRLIQR
jgi:hypothetical protein